MSLKADHGQNRFFTMENAVQAYRNGQMSMREAAKRFGVAQSTLSTRVNGISLERLGRPTTLSEFTETLLVKMLITCNDIGFSLTRPETLDIVESYLKETNQSQIFKNGRPSDDWYYDFIKRHDNELTLRYSSNMPSNRAMATDPVLFEAWFEKMKKIYDEHNFY